MPALSVVVAPSRTRAHSGAARVVREAVARGALECDTAVVLLAVAAMVFLVVVVVVVVVVIECREDRVE
jgi:heme/copper-type cytochrome/quinol oxidase subunit 2